MEKICKFEHSTSRENLKNINQSGHLHAKAYVTLDPIKNMTSDQRVLFLELDSQKKGECVYECKEQCKKMNFNIPIEGVKTSGGASQYILPQSFSINKCSYACEGDEYLWGVISGGIGALVGYVSNNNKKEAFIGGITGFLIGYFMGKNGLINFSANRYFI